VNIDLIEKHRDINTDYDWWDCTYDHFAEDMRIKHIEVDKMLFSGFWSQGDGASFTGSISDSKAFMETHDLTETYPTVMRYLNKGGVIYSSLSLGLAITMSMRTLSALNFATPTIPTSETCFPVTMGASEML
jgi:hypothetical protein